MCSNDIREKYLVRGSTLSPRIVPYIMVLSVLALGLQGSAAGWLYDGAPIWSYGVGMGAGCTTDMAAQPLGFNVPVEITAIGLAIAGGPDPSGNGFRITLTDDLYQHTPPLGMWNARPINGPLFEFVYLSITPTILEAMHVYYLIISPDSEQFMGGIAFGSHGYIGKATNDNGLTWYDIRLPLGVRLGGSVVPEPSGVLTMIAGLLMLAASRTGRSNRSK